MAVTADNAPPLRCGTYRLLGSDHSVPMSELNRPTTCSAGSIPKMQKRGVRSGKFTINFDIF